MDLIELTSVLMKKDGEASYPHIQTRWRFSVWGFGFISVTEVVAFHVNRIYVYASVMMRLTKLNQLVLIESLDFIWWPIEFPYFVWH